MRGFVAGALLTALAGLLDQAAEATDAAGGATEASLRIEKDVADGEKAYRTALVAANACEAAVLVFVTTAFVTFFPASIVMFRRVERRLDNIVQEMNLRSDHGNVLLPFEFSPPAADGSETQTEMPIVDARAFLRELKSSAAAQRRKFILCLFLVMSALLALTSHTMIFNIIFAEASHANRNHDCDPCASCQSVWFLVYTWYISVPEIVPLRVSLSLSIPLLFSLWLMTTPEDRALLLNPRKFLTDEIRLHPVETESDARLRSERIRMGINLQ